MDFSSYINFLKEAYPSAYNFVQQKPWKPVFFFEPVSLSCLAYQKIETVVQSLFQLKNKEDYQQEHSSAFIKHLLKTEAGDANTNSLPDLGSFFQNNKQDSVLTAYDFHLKDGVPQLIEVNTNASGFLLLNSFYQFKNKDYQSSIEKLKHSFQKEWEKFDGHKSSVSPKKIVLIDEEPLNQKMAIEFFMYKDLFQSMGWSFEICDARTLKMDKDALYTSKGDKIDFVYNRSTDFYFEDHPSLKKAYVQKVSAFSPHPKEYHLLANKYRLCDWSVQKNKWEELKRIKAYLPHTQTLSLENKEHIWSQRKKYFFKPSKSYGGKLVYRGSGLRRKKFDYLCELQGIAQEYIPPSVVKDKQGEGWKVDFRAYVYEGQIQQLGARCYKGQLTNFQEEGSGFAIVQLEQ